MYHNIIQRRVSGERRVMGKISANFVYKVCYIDRIIILSKTLYYNIRMYCVIDQITLNNTSIRSNGHEQGYMVSYARFKNIHLDQLRYFLFYGFSIEIESHFTQ